MRKLLTILLLIAPLPVQATQDAWPALFDVAGVAADDVLNVRAGPSAGAEISGSLAPDATGIEVIRPDPRHRWGLVNLDEGTGWVSLAYLARQPGQYLGAQADPASCFGTEPFWTLSLDGDAASFSTPETHIEGRVTARLGSTGRRDRQGLRATFPGGARLDGVLSWETCSDGMSDRAYGIAFDALWGGDVLAGCCTLAR